MTKDDLFNLVLENLRDVRLRCPELRIGQLIAIVGELGQDETGHSLWDVEDADFAAAFERFDKDMARCEARRVEPAAASVRVDITSPESVTSQPPRPAR